MGDLTAVLLVVREFSDSNLDIHEMMEPPPDSPAGRDISAVVGHTAWFDRLTHGRALAGIRLGEAGRCLDACVVVSEMSEPDTAIHALARAAIDSSAWARWLCDLSPPSADGVMKRARELE